METSDSECFESADEEFYLEDDNMKTKAVTVVSKKSTPEAPKQENPTNKNAQVDNIKFEENIPSVNNNHTVKITDKVDNVTVPTSTDKPANKRDKPKLGSKIIKKSDLNLPEKNEEVEEVVSVTTDKVQRPEYGIPPAKVVCPFPSNSPLNADHKESNDSKPNDQEDKEKEELNMWEDDEDWEPEPIQQKTQQQQQQTKPQEEPNLWENDDWEPITNTTEDKPKLKNDGAEDDFNGGGWPGWSNWGVSSLLSTATTGVTTITNRVSQGITTVLESGIGVPDPEELAKLHLAEKNQHQQQALFSEGEEKTDAQQSNNPSTATSNLTFGLGNLVSGVTQITKLVETTGTKVIAGGLDTLETIGKKTMEVLQEGDPGLKKKRAFLKIESDKPVLSQVLREAKEKAEQNNREREEKHFSKKANYESLFDDHQGLVHLEALEMLSKQCDIKLQTILASQSGNDLILMQETLDQVKELCELNADEDDEEEETTLDVSEIKEKIDSAVSEINISISYDKLISTWTETEDWLQNLNLNVCNELELHEQAIDTLAQLTAIAVEQFHKAGELLLIKELHSTANETDSLVRLTMIITNLISNMATKLSNKLIEKTETSRNKENINSLITNVYFEAANSSSYIKNAFHLLIPILQVGAV